ncbi:MAG TPA: hypothetical protein VII92_13235, partial [Anaerolineae bacterium]
ASTPTPTGTPTVAGTATSTKSPFNYEVLDFHYQRHQLNGTQWAGIAGLVFELIESINKTLMCVFGAIRRC